MKTSFFNNEKALLTVMVQAHTPKRIKELMDKSAPKGAEAYGIQFEQINPEYRKKEIYRELFSYAEDKPVYVTNYRGAKNEGKDDETLAKEMIELSESGADLCDVMGDYFDKREDEVAISKEAIKKQKELIEKIHDNGSKVLMSSHVFKYTPAKRVLEIALEHQSRGADICKIVTGADTTEQQLENLKIINMLKENLKIPFLFLCCGECDVLRRIGGELGCCMYLCVNEYDELATAVQPLLEDVKTIRDTLRKQK